MKKIGKKTKILLALLVFIGAVWLWEASYNAQLDDSNSQRLCVLWEEAGFDPDCTTVTFQGDFPEWNLSDMVWEDPALVSAFYEEFGDLRISSTHLKVRLGWEPNDRFYTLLLSNGQRQEAMTFYLQGVKNTYVTWMGTDYYCAGDSMGGILNFVTAFVWKLET